MLFDEAGSGGMARQSSLFQKRASLSQPSGLSSLPGIFKNRGLGPEAQGVAGHRPYNLVKSMAQ